MGKNYVNLDKMQEIVRQFAIIYDPQHYHGGTGYVTPKKKRSCQAEEILKARAGRKRLTRLHWLSTNSEQESQSNRLGPNKNAALADISLFPLFILVTALNTEG